MTEIGTEFPRETPLVLITDDDSAIRSLLMLALQEDGYEVAEAINGSDCLAKYPRLQPDLVLLDAVMPEMDGFTCCHHLRRFPQGKQVPILMITFLDDHDSIDQAFQSGATDYITKPIHWSVLRHRVKHLLASAQILREAEAAKGHLSGQQAWEQFFRSILRQFSQSSHFEDILPNFLASIQEFFAVERVIFYPLACNQPLVEAVAPQYPSVQEIAIEDLGLETEYAEQYQQGQAIAINDLSQIELSTAIREQFTQLRTLSVLIAPILIDNQVWGLLCAHLAETARLWEPLEIERFMDLANLLVLVL